MFLLETFNKNQLLPGYRVESVYDSREKSVETLQQLSTTYALSSFTKLESFLESDVDIIIECAGIQVVTQYATRIVTKKDLLITSVGALVDIELYNELRTTSALNNRKVYLPSGAIGGLDIIKAAKVAGGLDEVALVTRKPLAALLNESLTRETILFEGTAKEAIERYPKNMNVAITLSLAGIGVEKTKVKIIADPSVEKNIHSIRARGAFGEMEMKIENNPSPSNPQTSYLTALSILSSLKSLNEEICIG
ncbi:aspartate dehydrogenase [Sporosarcina sp. G11-34]|nr:aspartate dehydrogenase [Sporosarcina sp. G11-34]